LAKEKDILMCNYDVLFNSTYKPSSLYKYFQQIATEDLDALGLNAKTMKERGIAFVLVRMKTVFKKPIFEYDLITIKTCHRRVKGASFIRDYLVYRNGELIGETSSYWALIDLNSRRLMRPSSLEGDFNHPVELCSFEIDERFSFPEDLECKTYEYNIVFNDIDENKHMNNTRYVDICLDAISGIAEDEFVSEIRIDFLKEAKMDEKLLLKYAKGQSDNTFYFSSYNKSSQQSCFDAKITFKKI